MLLYSRNFFESTAQLNVRSKSGLMAQSHQMSTSMGGILWMTSDHQLAQPKTLTAD